ncbi:MAG: hypothetical protein Hyperionvirus3_7 [Hyperionvirus sp.]|uniref:Uncharacterized protein n=1 Tax=Hyperionvirus sp. TaxID=2487770 RepID=A0A3G5A9J8_9VIRU|nr:MAG: hypothetical protein Hyperionvirus3_7 [Hyperionvirus sp.]
MPPKEVHLRLPVSEIEALSVQHKFVKREISALIPLLLWPLDESSFRKMKNLVETGEILMCDKSGTGIRWISCPASLSDIMGPRLKRLEARCDLRTVSAEKHEKKLKVFCRDEHILHSMCTEIKSRFNHRIDDSLTDGFCDRKIALRFGKLRVILNPRTGVISGVPSDEKDKFEGLFNQSQPLLEKTSVRVLSEMRNWIFLEMPQEAIKRGCRAHVCIRDGALFHVNEIQDDDWIFLRTFKVDHIERNKHVTVNMVSINEGQLFLLVRDHENRSVQTLVVDVLNGAEIEKSTTVCFRANQNLSLTAIGLALSPADFERRDTIQIRLIPFSESQNAEMQEKLSQIVLLFPKVIVNLFMKYLI